MKFEILLLIARGRICIKMNRIESIGLRVTELANVDLDLVRRRTLLLGENATDKCYLLA